MHFLSVGALMVLCGTPDKVVGFVALHRPLAFKTEVNRSPLFRRQLDDPVMQKLYLSSSPNDKNTDEASPPESTSASSVDRTTFDEAGRSLLDEQDMKRMDAMGDFDVNPNVRLRMI
jgi:hypothetical protein